MSRLSTPKKLSTAELLTQLNKKKLLHDTNNLSDKVLVSATKPILSLLNRFWSISGAFTIANLILWTMAITGIIHLDNHYTPYLFGDPGIMFELILGSALVLNGMRLHVLNKNTKPSFLSGFSLQESISSIILGYYLLVLATINFTTINMENSFKLFGSVTPLNIFGFNTISLYLFHLSITTFVISILLFRYFQRPSIQFTSFFITLLFLGLSITIQQPLNISIVFNKTILTCFILLSLSMIYLIFSRQTKHYYYPLSNALVVSFTIAGSILFIIPLAVVGTSNYNQFYYNGYFAIYELPYFVLGLVIISTFKIAGNIRSFFTWPYILICLMASIISILPLDGINISILLILLGTQNGMSIFRILGFIFYTLYLMTYTYGLNMSITEQTLILSIHAIILTVVAEIIRIKYINKETKNA
ncbi:hypothetical protein N9N03_01130 [Chlamydiia bacterium]|nr:hypothetical protein [Chlamydiia bacterium]